MMRHYKLKKELPYHQIGEYLIGSGGDKGFYIWEYGKQYALQAELIENSPEWFEEDFPDWTQNEPCHYLTLNGMIISEYFNREKHSSLVRYGNIFKNKSDAELANMRIRQTLGQTDPLFSDSVEQTNMS